MVEIAKALSIDARIVILDEPTSSLPASESDKLLDVIAGLKARGIAVIFISHRLHEVERVADRVVVLRDGALAGTLEKAEIDHDRMVKLMIGRDLKAAEAGHARAPGAVALSAVERPHRRLSLARRSTSTSTTAKSSALPAWSAPGARNWRARCSASTRATAATSSSAATTFRFRHRRAMRWPRASFWCRRTARARASCSTCRSRKTSRCRTSARTPAAFWCRKRSEAETAETQRRSLAIKAPSVATRTGSLSGGNQQKVVLGKWLAMNPKVMIFDEPTRGIDIGAKAEIYRLMRGLADAGVAVLMISSDMEEVIGVSDRIAVMHEGRISGYPRPRSVQRGKRPAAGGGQAAHERKGSRRRR